MSSRITMDSGEDEFTMTFVAEDKIQSATPSAAWLTITNADFDNAKFGIKAAANTTGKDRTGYVTVKNSTLTKVIEVFQPAASTVFAVLSPSSINMPKAQTAYTLSAYLSTGAGSTADPKIAMTTDAAWITLGADTFNGTTLDKAITVAENTTYEVRSAIVKVTATAQDGTLYTDEFVFNQAASENVLDIPMDYLVFATAGETKQLSFVSSDPISVASGAVAWLHPTNGSVITIAADANTTGYDRDSYVTVSNGKKIVKIKVFQPAATTSFAVLTPKLAVPYETTSPVDVQVYGSTGVAATNLTATSAVAWLTVGALDATASPIGKFPVTVAKNTTGKPRVGTITVVWYDQKGEAHTGTVEIAQSSSENILDVYADSIILRTAGETQQFNIYSTVEDAANLKAFSSSPAPDGWLTVAVTADYFKVTAPANPNGESRFATVTIKATFADGSTQQKIVNVEQLGTETYFVLIDPTIHTDATAHTVDVRYLCNEDPAPNVQIFADVTWITANDLAGNPLKLNVEANTGTTPRTGHVKIYYTPEGKEPIEKSLTIVQTNP